MAAAVAPGLAPIAANSDSAFSWIASIIARAASRIVWSMEAKQKRQKRNQPTPDGGLAWPLAMIRPQRAPVLTAVTRTIARYESLTGNVRLSFLSLCFQAFFRAVFGLRCPSLDLLAHRAQPLVVSYL